MHNCGYFALSNGLNREDIWIIPIFGVIFGQNVGFDPPGSPCIGLAPTVMQLILMKYHHVLSWMHICGYFALSNGPSREVIWIIPKFWVIFGQNMGIWPPGVLMYRFTPRCFATYFEEIVSRFVLKVIFYIGHFWNVRNGIKWLFRLFFLVKN